MNLSKMTKEELYSYIEKISGGRIMEIYKK